MPIGASAGTLDIENATLRSNAIAVLTNLVTGNDAVRSSGAPTLEVYGDPSNGGNEARLELVSNLSVENSKSFTRLTSNAGVFSIQSGTDGSTNGPITFGGFSNERMRITADGNVGVGTDSPGGKLDIRGSVSDPSIPTVHIGDNAADFGDYGMVNLVRNPAESGTKAHLAFVRNGNTIFSQGYYNNTNTFGFWPSFNSVVNVPAMSITTTGNVGIGRTNPACALDIAGEDVMIRGNTPSLNFSEGTGAMDGGFRIRYDGANEADGNNFLAIQTGASFGITAIHCTYDGKVGIGTTSPSTPLDVPGGIASPGFQAQYGLTCAGLVSWTGTHLSWVSRIIAIPVEKNEFGASGFLDMYVPTSGTSITYYHGNNTITTKATTADGFPIDRKSTRLNSSHPSRSRMPSSA